MYTHDKWDLYDHDLLPDPARIMNAVQAPYLKISENNTSVKLQGGRWTFSYLL
jgi:hypothetical protein